MSINPFVFAKTLLQYLKGESLSADEAKEVEDAIKTRPSIQRLCEELQDKEEVSNQLAIIASFDIDIAYNKVSKSHKAKRYKLYFKIAVAAILIITAIPVLYLMTEDKTYNSSLIGCGKTILKTSDGCVVSLDTLSHTQLLNDLSIQNMQDILVIENKNTSKRSKNNKTNIIEVPHKGMHKIILPDGTRVSLNSVSTLEFSNDFYLNNRVVTLNGEAYFDVAKLEGKPFIVKTKELTIRVLGTKFNVSDYNDDLNAYATLLEGKIELLGKGSEQEILPGEQIVFDKKTKKTNVKDVDITPVIAWSDKVFYFDQTPLEDIMNRLSRWYDLDVEYRVNDPRIKQMAYSGKVKMYAHPEDILRKFEKTGNLKFELKNNTIVISRK